RGDSGTGFQPVSGSPKMKNETPFISRGIGGSAHPAIMVFGFQFSVKAKEKALIRETPGT
ncbi:MAG: hypothetical protein WA228_02365, partial [Desulfobaccales bacterium]